MKNNQLKFCLYDGVQNLVLPERVYFKQLKGIVPSPIDSVLEYCDFIDFCLAYRKHSMV